MQMSGTIVPELDSNDVLVQIDDLPGLAKRQGSATRTLLGVMAMPLTQLGYDRDADGNSKESELFERKTEYAFGSGERIQVTQNSNGIGRDGQLQMNVNYQGDIPQINSVRAQFKSKYMDFLVVNHI